MQHAAYSISQLQAHVLHHDQNPARVQIIYKSSVRKPPVWSTETRIRLDFRGLPDS